MGHSPRLKGARVWARSVALICSVFVSIQSAAAATSAEQKAAQDSPQSADPQKVVGSIAKTTTDDKTDPAKQGQSLDNEQESDAEYLVPSAPTYTVQGAGLPAPGVDIDLRQDAFAADLGEKLERSPGLRVLRSGDSLAPTELRLRGLGGARLRVSVDGQVLDDPSGRPVDLAALDAQALDHATLRLGPQTGALGAGAVAGVLALRSAQVKTGWHAQSRISAGNFAQRAVQGRLAWGGARTQLRLSLGQAQSQGNFAYRSLSFSGDQVSVGPEQERANNDQQRSMATLIVRHQESRWTLDSLLMWQAHEAGVAGLSGHPSATARSWRQSLWLSQSGTYYTPSGMLGLQVLIRQAQSLDRLAQELDPSWTQALWSRADWRSSRVKAFWQQPALWAGVDAKLSAELAAVQAAQGLGRFNGAENNLGFALRAEALSPSLNRDAQRLSQAVGLDLGRAWGGGCAWGGHRGDAAISLRYDFIEDFAFFGQAKADPLRDPVGDKVRDKVLAEPSAALRLAWGLSPALSLVGDLGRSFRAPSFFEKFGPPGGYFRANPDLLPERSTQLSTGLRWQSRRRQGSDGTGVAKNSRLKLRQGPSEVQGSLFVARLDETILYLNRNAYEIRPENAGALWRAGGELHTHFNLLTGRGHSGGQNWRQGLSQDVAVELLLSALDLTGAALPSSPALSLWTRSSWSGELLGLNLGSQLFVEARARSQSSANIFGELTLPAQAVINLGLALHFSPEGLMSCQVSNLLDARARVDLRQVPLPGRDLRCTLQVGL